MQQYELARFRIFTRRVAVLGAIKLALLSVVGNQLYNLQIVNRQKYLTKADENRINIRLLPPPRGRIFDRAGRLVAHNKQNFRLVLVPEQSGDIQLLLHTLAKTVPLGQSDRARILNEIGRRRSFIPITVREHLSWFQVAQIEIDAPDLPGVSIEVGQVRQYPFGATFAHVIGYVGSASTEEITSDTLLQLPGFRV